MASKMYANMASISRCLLMALIFVQVLLGPKVINAEESSNLSGFASVWKLMSSADRELFVSGYLRGWQDAAEFLDIAQEFVASNPNHAADALAKLKELSSLGEQKPAPLVAYIDQYYRSPENQGAPLSKAVSAARISAARPDVE
jgi:hypothetical protein